LKVSRAEPKLTEENIQQPVQEERDEPTLTEAITPSDTQVSKEALPELPTEGLVVPKGRNRQVVAAGKLFDMTAAEKAAWNKTKIDFAEAAPELKGLSDKAVAAKMMDRKWVDGTIVKLRDKAARSEERRVGKECE
jgi:hypothetical protein